ncbi:Aste57867_21074 [Aphanomyces stellatus]|uniref:Aste57867_21074 protein n=1 Tax=Aphanomyces stellatus TaxID=120398 RepID=A0A485LGP3_9STRA|nr:hypothetical protein As57867_021006 [Aphanomyces stellatus]VFT97748.1 Aste57867_21074 [Aphanomyces stellatus]
MDVLASSELMTRIFTFQHGHRLNSIFDIMGKSVWEVSPSSYGLVDNDRRLARMLKIDTLLPSWYVSNGGVANVIATTRGETPLAVLAAHCAFQGDVPALRLLVEKIKVLCTKANLIDWAACNGHLDVIEFLHTSTAGLAKSTSWAMEIAAAHGHLHVLKWLHQHRGQRFSSKILVAAAVHSRLDILKWISEHKAYGSWWRAARNAAIENTDAHAWFQLPATQALMEHGTTNAECHECTFKMAKPVAEAIGGRV